MLFFLGMACQQPAELWSAEPILVTVSVHGHNYKLDTTSLTDEVHEERRLERYTAHRTELLWLAEQASAEGLLLSVQLNGEYALDAMRYDDTEHLHALRAEGHELSAHFHRFLLAEDGVSWTEYLAHEATEARVRQTWTDHITAIEAAIGEVPIRVDAATGTQTPEQLALLDELEDAYDIQMSHNWGERLSYTPWNIKPFTPFRRAAGTYMVSDPDGHTVSTSALGQASWDPPQGYHAIYSAPEQSRRHLLMLQAERRWQALQGNEDVIWQFGAMTHLDLNAANREAVAAVLADLGALVASGAGEAASDRLVMERFVAWEERNPGEVSFTFDWSAWLSGEDVPLPYALEGVICGLKDSELHGRMDLDDDGVTAYSLRGRQIDRVPLGDDGLPGEMTVGESLGSLLLLWVMDGLTGTVRQESASHLTVGQAPIVVAEELDLLEGCQE